jgi:signal peptidase I
MKATQHLLAGNSLRNRILSLATALCLTLGALAPLAAHAGAPSSGVPFADVLADARKVAELNTGWKVFKVEGQSMLPHFGENSLLLAARTDFKALRAGMLVVYKDGTGDLVAHRIIECTAQGWIAKGFNNDKVDPGLVTSDNLQGVVFGIFNYKSGTDQLALADARNNPPVAFAKTY